METVYAYFFLTATPYLNIFINLHVLTRGWKRSNLISVFHYSFHIFFFKVVHYPLLIFIFSLEVGCICIHSLFFNGNRYLFSECSNANYSLLVFHFNPLFLTPLPHLILTNSEGFKFFFKITYSPLSKKKPLCWRYYPPPRVTSERLPPCLMPPNSQLKLYFRR